MRRYLHYAMLIKVRTQPLLFISWHVLETARTVLVARMPGSAYYPTDINLLFKVSWIWRLIKGS